jgi:hypothetical protein
MKPLCIALLGAIVMLADKPVACPNSEIETDQAVVQSLGNLDRSERGFRAAVIAAIKLCPTLSPAERDKLKFVCEPEKVFPQLPAIRLESPRPIS